MKSPKLFKRKTITPADFAREAMHVSFMSIAVNIFLSVGKLAAGILGHSVAMVSDAIHSASDVFSTLIVMAGIKLSDRRADDDHPYGHEKLEYIASLLLAILLGLTGLGIGYEGCKSIYTGEYLHVEIPTLMPLIAAVVSIVVKELMFHYTKDIANRINSGSLLADAWHHRSDALSSIGSFVGIAAARLGYPIMDSIASIIICLMILAAAKEIFIDATDKLVDHSCNDEMTASMRKHVLDQPGVIGIDIIRCRMFGAKYYVDIDIAADGDLTLYQAHDIAEHVHHSIEYNFPAVKHCMVHVSPVVEES